MYILYKIFNNDELVYLGRTRQPLNRRLRGHFFKGRLQKHMDIFQVTRVEYAEFNTCADMYLYEIYYINKLHPPLNRDDVAPDELTVELPEVPFAPFEFGLLEKWRAEKLARKAEITRKRLETRRRNQLAKQVEQDSVTGAPNV